MQVKKLPKMPPKNLVSFDFLWGEGGKFTPPEILGDQQSCTPLVQPLICPPHSHALGWWSQGWHSRAVMTHVLLCTSGLPPKNPTYPLTSEIYPPPLANFGGVKPSGGLFGYLNQLRVNRQDDQHNKQKVKDKNLSLFSCQIHFVCIHVFFYFIVKLSIMRCDVSRRRLISYQPFTGYPVYH